MTMKAKYYAFLFILIGMGLYGCLPYEEPVSEINLDIKQPVFQRIYSYQNQQLVDSLYPFFEHEEASVRYAAALAFASFADEMYNDTLASLLDDRNDAVRSAAAYAIGQSGSDGASDLLIQAF